MKDSTIGWCHHTFNPWIGCTEVSPGCDNCYARELAARFKKAEWGRGKPRVRTSENYWRQPLSWAKAAAARGVRERVFCASLADVGDAEVSMEWFAELCALIRETNYALDWLLLTKRPAELVRRLRAARMEYVRDLWLGVTVESNDYRWRLDEIQNFPAAVWFVSAEPLLGPLNLFDERVCPTCEGSGLVPVNGNGSRLASWDCATGGAACPVCRDAYGRVFPDWVIAGCESGPGKRPGKRAADDKWFSDLRRECQQRAVPFFLKQRVIEGHVVEAPELDGRTWQEVPR